MTDAPVTPQALSFAVRPIEEGEFERVPHRCWPRAREVVERLFAEQGTPGFAAWDGERCIGQLHAYRLNPPEPDEGNFPEWARENPRLWPLGWPLATMRHRRMRFRGPVLGLACYHVGITCESPEAAEPKYFHRGIGTALCRAAVGWAREHAYAAVVALGGPANLFDYAAWMGALPWTTYAKLGFRSVAMEEDGRRLPAWAEKGATPLVVTRVREALAEGRPIEAICARVMVLEL